MNIVRAKIKIVVQGKVKIHSQNYNNQEQRQNHPHNPSAIQTHLNDSAKFARYRQKTLNPAGTPMNCFIRQFLTPMHNILPRYCGYQNWEKSVFAQSVLMPAPPGCRRESISETLSSKRSGLYICCGMTRFSHCVHANLHVHLKARSKKNFNAPHILKIL